MSLLTKTRPRKPKLTTVEAFKSMLYDPELIRANAGSKTKMRYIYTCRQRFKDGKDLTVEKMEELLKKNGWKIAQEKLWKK